MFERYREDARRALFFSVWQAKQAGSAYIEPEHLLLSLTHDTDSKANQLFALAAHAETFRKQFGLPIQAEHAREPGDRPLSNAGKRVVAYAAEEADRLGSTAIGTEHLLLGLLREKKSDVPQTLAKAGIDLRSARNRIRAAQGLQIPDREPDDKETSLRPMRPFAAFFLLVAVLSLAYLLIRLVNS